MGDRHLRGRVVSFSLAVTRASDGAIGAVLNACDAARTIDQRTSNGLALIGAGERYLPQQRRGRPRRTELLKALAREIFRASHGTARTWLVAGGLGGAPQRGAGDALLAQRAADRDLGHCRLGPGAADRLELLEADILGAGNRAAGARLIAGHLGNAFDLGTGDGLPREGVPLLDLGRRLDHVASTHPTSWARAGTRCLVDPARQRLHQPMLHRDLTAGCAFQHGTLPILRRHRGGDPCRLGYALQTVFAVLVQRSTAHLGECAAGRLRRVHGSTRERWSIHLHRFDLRRFLPLGAAAAAALSSATALSAAAATGVAHLSLSRTARAQMRRRTGCRALPGALQPGFTNRGQRLPSSSRRGLQCHRLGKCGRCRRHRRCGRSSTAVVRTDKMRRI